MLPTKKGVTLTIDMWRKLIGIANDVDKVIDSMEKGQATSLENPPFGGPSASDETNEY